MTLRDRNKAESGYEASTGAIREIISLYCRTKRGVVYLYGSAVSGKSRADSDVDIALLTEPYSDQIESCKARVRYQVDISRLIE